MCPSFSGIVPIFFWYYDHLFLVLCPSFSGIVSIFFWYYAHLFLNCAHLFVVLSPLVYLGYLHSGLPFSPFISKFILIIIGKVLSSSPLHTVCPLLEFRPLFFLEGLNVGMLLDLNVVIFFLEFHSTILFIFI